MAKEIIFLDDLKIIQKDSDKSINVLNLLQQWNELKGTDRKLPNEFKVDKEGYLDRGLFLDFIDWLDGALYFEALTYLKTNE